MTTESYNEIGKLLRQARQERRLDLEEIAQVLHIRVRYLDALESGKLNELPGLSYTKGYLQVYATYVGLDKDEILRRFEEVETALEKHGFYLPQVFRKEKTPNSSVIWGGLAAAVLVYIIWLGVSHSSRLSMSIIEPFPKPDAATVADVACLNPHAVLYPACTTARPPRFNLVSLQARIKVSVAPAVQKTVEK